MTNTLGLGVAGLGTVGCGTIEILQKQKELLTQRCGRILQIAGVSARTKDKARHCDVSGYTWFDDPLAMVEDKSIAIIVEAIGGSEGVARELVEAALKAGKPVVTANKALIADHGLKLAQLAEAHHTTLAFEAAVAGGIPIIKAMREGLSANQFSHISGILNGTANYILTRMWEEHRNFEDVLTEAQDKGYAEADPSFDIDGIDTLHKVAILTSLAFGVAPAADKIHVEGIRDITLRDMEFADELGYKIKLLGITSKNEQGIMQRVHPSMVPATSPLGTVDDVFNAVQAEGDAVGTVFFEGRGAGAGPTGSSMVSDIIDIARGATYHPFILPTGKLNRFDFVPMDQLHTSYYLRLGVEDKPGVLAGITDVFSQEGISVQSVIQHDHAPEECAQIVLTTHKTSEANMKKALQAIEQLPAVTQPPYMIRIEQP